jgi:hypothetical protein
MRWTHRGQLRRRCVSRPPTAWPPAVRRQFLDLGVAGIDEGDRLAQRAQSGWLPGRARWRRSWPVLPGRSGDGGGRGHQRIAIALLPKFEQPGDGGDGKRGAEGQAEQAQLPGDRLVAAGWRGHRCQSRATRKAESGAGRLADGWQLEG